MQVQQLVLVIVLFADYCAPASNPQITAASYCYTEPVCDESTWGGTCSTGTEQSPINFDLKPFKPRLVLPTKFTLNRQYATEAVHRFFAHNNGHTAQFVLNPDTSALTSDLIIGGGHLNQGYKFGQLHFHWGQTDNVGSEHTVNGRRYPLELHIVHYRSNYPSLDVALSSTADREAGAVMAIFFKITPFKVKNKALDSIITALATLKQPGEVTPFNLKLRISDLYPHKLEFARYLGSLTSPTCDEKIIWTVFLRPLEITPAQMAAFRKLSNEEGISAFNYRTVQPLNGRSVQYYRAKGMFLVQDDASTSLVQFTNLAQIILGFLARLLPFTFNVMKNLMKERLISKYVFFNKLI